MNDIQIELPFLVLTVTVIGDVCEADVSDTVDGDALLNNTGLYCLPCVSPEIITIIYYRSY